MTFSVRTETETDTIRSPWARYLSKIWWRHQMETFSALLALCAGSSPVTGQWHGALFSLICALNKRLSRQSWGSWFETPLRPLWHHCNEKLKCFLTRFYSEVSIAQNVFLTPLSLTQRPLMWLYMMGNLCLGLAWQWIVIILIYADF